MKGAGKAAGMATERIPGPGLEGQARSIKVAVALSTGLNLRVSCEIAKTSSGFPCMIGIRKGGSTADGKGILSIMSLGADTGTLLEITAKGPGANDAVDILAGLTTSEGHRFFSTV